MASWTRFTFLLAASLFACASEIAATSPPTGEDASDSGAAASRDPRDPSSTDAGMPVDGVAPPSKADGSNAPDTGPLLDADGCMILSAGAFEPSGYSDQHVQLEGALGGQGGPIRITLFRGELSAKSYVLGVAPDDPFASPKHARVEATAFGVGGGDFYASGGTLALTSLPSPMSVEIAGNATSLKFVEVAYADGGVIAKPQGRCLSIASLVFDTRVAIGAPCSGAMTCGAKACDPLTLTCLPPTCTVEGPAGNGMFCKRQSGWHEQAALYRACSLGATPNGCAPDEECIGASSVSPSTEGYCLKRGMHGLDSPCTGESPGDSSDVSTGCTAGLLCRKLVGLELRCGKRCELFGPAGQCGAAERCQSSYANAVCAPKPPVLDDAALDEPCTQTTSTLCADDGAALRGICVAETLLPNAPQTCRKICRTSADCTGGKTCQTKLTTTLRVCI